MSDNAPLITGTDFITVPTQDSGVCHQAFFSDPDGNALAIHHRYAPPEASPTI